jgi:hypothetical protein
MVQMPGKGEWLCAATRREIRLVIVWKYREKPEKL